MGQKKNDKKVQQQKLNVSITFFAVHNLLIYIFFLEPQFLVLFASSVKGDEKYNIKLVAVFVKTRACRTADFHPAFASMSSHCCDVKALTRGGVRAINLSGMTAYEIITR
eukprot:GEMP01114310.1.p1 GENE.GEMP01114310.1~~GEMP01114310.1.p1  ORF type:complete len:110 (-),score=16.30 GEMP01114310.1:196-525(-)